jgi:hypothetical protein
VFLLSSPTSFESEKLKNTNRVLLMIKLSLYFSRYSYNKNECVSVEQ